MRGCSGAWFGTAHGADLLQGSHGRLMWASNCCPGLGRGPSSTRWSHGLEEWLISPSPTMPVAICKEGQAELGCRHRQSPWHLRCFGASSSLMVGTAGRRIQMLVAAGRQPASPEHPQRRNGRYDGGGTSREAGARTYYDELQSQSALLGDASWLLDTVSVQSLGVGNVTAARSWRRSSAMSPATSVFPGSPGSALHCGSRCRQPAWRGPSGAPPRRNGRYQSFNPFLVSLSM